MDTNQIRDKYLSFFQKRNHAIIPSASLVPEGDATTLFTSAGMQAMMPYLLGSSHPQGNRIVDSQKCFRSQDIEEVGDNRHTTFFEMLGNWSLGDYFKKEQLEFFFTFLTDQEEGLGLPPEKIFVSVFEGNKDISKDEEAIKVWQDLFKSKGVDAKEGERIFSYPASKNWWSRAGEPENMPEGEPGGPDSEVFFDFGPELKLHESSPFKDKKCHINCDCGRFLEIGNSVFMQYQKQKDGTLKELPQKNIDFGGGLHRIEATQRNDPDAFNTSSYSPLIKKLEELTGKKYQDEENKSAMRIIADHLTASTFLIKDGVFPSNKTQGYVLRRLLRRASVKMYFLTGSKEEIKNISSLSDEVIKIYQEIYFENDDQEKIKEVINQELNKFSQSLERGLRELQKTEKVDGKVAFDLYQNFGFPLEITTEILSQNGKEVNKIQFEEEFEKHKNLSRTASAGMFKGGLADSSQTTTAYHTATHLLHSALRKTLGDHVQQKGSNITSDRLRFDFSHSEKLTDDELEQIEKNINENIAKALPVVKREMPKDKALSQGALAFFGQKYPDKVNVYTIGDKDNPISKELCGGPHVQNTKELAMIKIDKQESVGGNTRRLYLKFV